MALKHYGLDSAEIEHLKAANLTDEEINDLNKKRVQEQMDEENDEADDGIGLSDSAKKIMAVIPGAHPAVIGYIMSKGVIRPDEDLEKAGQRLMDRIKSSGGMENLNKAMTNAWGHLKDSENIDIANPDEYDFSDENRDALLREIEKLQKQGTSDAEKIANDLFNIYGSFGLAESLLSDIFPKF